MRNIRWLDSAELDLTNIIRYVGMTFGSDTALQVLDDVMLRIETLGEFPFLGTFYPLIRYQGLEVYTLHEHHTKVFYAIADSEIIIILVWNNLRDDNLIKAAIESAK